jgi:hypothetical protein
MACVSKMLPSSHSMTGIFYNGWSFLKASDLITSKSTYLV